MTNQSEVGLVCHLQRRQRNWPADAENLRPAYEKKPWEPLTKESYAVGTSSWRKRDHCRFLARVC
jgi:hypothetical protein